MKARFIIDSIEQAPRSRHSRSRSSGATALAVLLYSVLSLLFSCSSEFDHPPTIAANIFGEPGTLIPLLADEWQATFEKGEELARKRFTFADGLGPHFNVNACGSCHEGPVIGGGGPLYRNFVLFGERTASGAFVFTGNNAGVYPFFDREDNETEALSGARANVFAQRNPIPFFGLGLLTLVPDSEILSRSDPDDLDNDGISGRANYATGKLGRFGLKAQAASLEGFVRGPLKNHLGITTNPLSAENKARLPFAEFRKGSVQFALDSTTLPIQSAQFAQVAAPNEPLIDEDEIPDPELSESALFDILAWSMLLAAPKPDEPTTASTKGMKHFGRLGCANCHTPTLNSAIGLLPVYTDLLLHDMGQELADGIEMGFANGQEFRTAPLWGVSVTGPYLHDGSALTLQEAIERHGGEGAESARRFRESSAETQTELIIFLKSLGGSKYQSLGLVPNEAAPPVNGVWGSAKLGLSAEKREEFEAGFRLFDRNFGFAEGVGPHFNGDSCRACHFLGGVGGAGPRDVDVQRLVDFDTGAFTTRHRFHTPTRLPAPYQPHAFMERRNTPHLFGIGLFAEVPDSYLEAIADPFDLDQDGVFGRISWLDDGRSGRFGWQAEIASISEFVELAFLDELGMSRTEVDEFHPAARVLIEHFLMTLDVESQEDDEDFIETFERLGCDQCHRNDLPIENSRQPLTNLLLHDIGTGHFESGHPGNAYRTPPLWGLDFSPPYLHDGRADTIGDAISAHGIEADNSARAFENLSSGERELFILQLRSR